MCRSRRMGSLQRYYFGDRDGALPRFVHNVAIVLSRVFGRHGIGSVYRVDFDRPDSRFGETRGWRETRRFNEVQVRRELAGRRSLAECRISELKRKERNSRVERTVVVREPGFNGSLKGCQLPRSDAYPLDLSVLE